MSTGEPTIVVDRLTKRYKGADVDAVAGISFSIASGELFALLGPNGAGKTTTISMLTTTLSPTSGSARIAGHDLATEAAAVRSNVGIIFQRPSLDLNLTAEENVRFHAVLYRIFPYRPTFGLMPREYRDRVHELASVLGIDREIFKPVKTYSGGMRRKLEIVRSLMHRPRVLFLDEPTSGLDAASRRALWDYLREVRASTGATVLLTTHYLEEADAADTVCIINKGHIVAQGAPAKVKADLTAEYLLVDADDRDALRAELRRRDIAFSETPLFRIDIDGTPGAAHRLIRSIETPLTTVRTHAPSMEDAYLEVLRERQSETEPETDVVEVVT
ncbi:MAG TPA: ABC transporter ATP-binding protein [Candidatus Limnocylindria bacterium]|nr:ABC transporter ATP-binding protein [Candidatus Limnocylindria bacterium]